MADTPETARKKQRISKVWDHFRLKGYNVVQCDHCQAELAFHSSTSTMISHLNRKHPILVSSPTCDEDASTSVGRPIQSCSVKEAALLTESILTMLFTDLRPLSMVEDKGFRKMISIFNSKYNIPSVTYFTNMMQKKHQEMTEKLKNMLQDIDCVALTTDVWTSLTTESYLGVTCHFLGEDWEMKALNLTTMRLEERHTATDIADWLEETTARFDVPFSKVKALVHDNGVKVVAAACILKEKHGWDSVICSGHTLNLIVQNTLKNKETIGNCVDSARRLVEYFKKTEMACAELQEKQQKMGMPPLMLIQDVSARWDSTFHMLVRLLGQRWPVTAALSNLAVDAKQHHLDLNPEQWGLIEELTQVLGPFEGATEFLNGEQYVTLSALPQLVHNLKKSTLSFVLKTASVRAFQAQVAEQITEKWQKLFLFRPEAPNTFQLAAALDPRFRKLKFLPAEDVFKVQCTIQSMALAAKIETKQSNGSGKLSPAKSKDRLNTKYGSLLKSMLGSSSDSSSDEEEEDEDEQLSQVVQREVMQYFGEQPLSKRENPLLWWRTNAARYPTLAKLAKCFLAIPATSTPSERLFSNTANFASKRKASISNEHVDMLTFLHCNHMLL
ncbi:E3 SUMO-protein ligase ZBED1-like [Corythoichthys intestinalis]|uniref:E3 SUMO-protein ligase ZBED1-like n=1 Tax=Corythoichthys intestinalis TaxID=161448 RepID=UPI0025A55407|nr:E3 SUMO-protein ligase ZBED1-like [Corythoichthys intestinalis]